MAKLNYKYKGAVPVKAYQGPANIMPYAQMTSTTPAFACRLCQFQASNMAMTLKAAMTIKLNMAYLFLFKVF